MAILASSVKHIVYMEAGMQSFVRIGAITVGLIVTYGCASITEGTTQSILVDLDPKTAECEVTRKDASIAIVNDDNRVINVSKSRNNLIFDCDAPGYEQSLMIIESTASTMGIIGCFLIDLCVTDYSTGALNKYPEAVKITLLRDEDAPITGSGPSANANGQDQDAQGGDGLRILLGTFSDRGAAKEAWEELKVDYPVLVEAKGGIVQTDDSVGTVFKLYALGLPRINLLKVCKSIREAGAYCEPVAA